MSDADALPVAVLSLPVISYALLCEISAGAIHWRDQAARPAPGENPASKREKAPAVAGPGLSCRGVTTILADRDVAP